MNRDNHQWLMAMSTLNQTSLKQSWKLINYDNIHVLFGRDEWKDKYVTYYLSDVQSADKLEIIIKPHDNLSEAVQHLDGKIKHVWFYIPILKYIIYIEGAKFLCVDYGNLAGNDTPTVEISGLKNPINDTTELQKAIDVSHEQMVKIAAIRKRLDPVYKTKCSYCSVPTGNKTPLTCSRCKLSYYCNRECQTNHWPEHKKTCEPIAHASPGQKVPMYSKDDPTKFVGSASVNQFFDEENKTIRSVFDIDPDDLIKRQKK